MLSSDIFQSVAQDVQKRRLANVSQLLPQEISAQMRSYKVDCFITDKKMHDCCGVIIEFKQL